MRKGRKMATVERKLEDMISISFLVTVEKTLDRNTGGKIHWGS